MSYQYQTFSSGQIFTGAQAQQIEDNIRDHVHGKDGVGASGASWATTSKGAAFTLTSADAGTLFKCWGDFAVTCPAAATLGGVFGAAFTNVGSGRVAINAASGQWIAGNSCYVLTPGEGVVLVSDTIYLDVVGGRDRACLARYVQTASSLAQFDIRFAGEAFNYIRVLLIPSTQTGGLNQMQVSIDSGQNFIAANYSNSTGAQTDRINLTFFNTTSRDCIYARSEFPNNADLFKSAQMHFENIGYRTGAQDIGFTRITTPLGGAVNALRFLRNGGFYDTGTRVEIWGEGRIRR